ncbi:TetR/AcrR family transcriptional regulator [Sphingomonas jatrophae]|uniref:Transcriptional regulator, TetR family n=1 Tax=Sphingomonas jatrophae TaxID=1166337 RepID=A0A1I6KIS4_9SPHN|nr:TetR family transcriptional regulator [Sphingomonas jatrophae]SFR91111.1 transcriptional regulator, TetR family [Sphingomonas jatrophae]
MADHDPVAASPARGVGRPRRLTLERLLDTAIAMGLAEISMKELAARLGVGIATLYRYVESRDALIRLAAGRQAARAAPADTGQDWAALVRDYAAALFSSLGQEPALVVGFLEARWGIAVELEFVDGFLGAMAARGVPGPQAMSLYRAMAKIVLGAAVASGHFAALAARGTGQARELGASLDAFDEDELPHLRAAAADYADEEAASDWRAPLDAVLRDAAIRFAGLPEIR